MKATPPAHFTLKKGLTLPVGVLITCSIAMIVLVHWLIGRADAATESLGQLIESGNQAAGSPLEVLQANLALVRWSLTFLACVAIGSAVCVVVFTARSIGRPVSHLIEVARAITHGRAKKRASPELAGDFRLLAEAFNQMIEARQEADERLKRANDSLELKVQARTVELYHSNKALREESAQREKAEREFHQAQKMEALGKLAGSIAHDFNNLLTVIIGGAEYAQKQLSASHPAVPLLQTVQQAGERAAGLTRPLLTFSRSEVLALEPLNLNESAEEASRMLERLLGVNIEIRMQLDPTLHKVKANGNQIQQLLINLGVNARDAMNGIGNLTMITRNALVSPEAIVQHNLSFVEDWVEVAVSDTGCGMDAATKARIFEPFFTTKPAGKGTGLGLATVFGIVKQTGGFLEVESSVGEGTTFRIFIPAASAEDFATPAAEELAGGIQVTTGDETLLLVDDEDDIRELATLTLEDLGYRVLSAANAEEAIVLAEEHGAEINALVTDVAMPGISGVQLAEVLLAMIPNLRVLFVSGYNNESLSSDKLALANADFLQKPYRSDALAQKVREILTEGSRHRKGTGERQLAA